MKKQKKGIYTLISICVLAVLCSCTNSNQNVYFKISARATGNGSITINPSSLATPGTLIKVTFNPEPGYRVKQYSIQASGVSGNNNTYTFSMPYKNVSVSAEFELISLPIEWYITRDAFNNITITNVNTNGNTDIIIPSEFDNNPVVAIGNEAFKNNTSLKTIEIPDSVTSIGSDAFYGCTSLETIEIPDSVTSIGSGAFYNCYNLETIEIPNSVTSIRSGAFYNCYNLETITIPNSVTSIGSDAFYGCTSLETIEIPDSVTSIGYWAFYNCKKLKTIEIPDSVVSIDYSVFRNCTGLETITLPNNPLFTFIYSTAFWGCTSLKTIIIPDSVTSIGNNAFENCTSLVTVTMLSPIVPTIDTDCFKNSNKSSVIFLVPNASLAGYKTALAEYVDNSITQIIGY